MNKLVLAIGLAPATATPVAAQDNPTAKAEFANLAGAKIGTAILTETSQGVLIDLEVTGLPAGEWVAFHVHETRRRTSETRRMPNMDTLPRKVRTQATCQISTLVPTACSARKFSIAWCG